MSKIVVIALGVLNIILFAPAVVATAISNPTPESFMVSFALAGFLFMVGALLVWASRDLSARAPVLFWNAMVRLFASSATIHAIQKGLAEAINYAFVVFDVSAAVILIAVALRTSQRSFGEFLMWRVG